MIQQLAEHYPQPPLQAEASLERIPAGSRGTLNSEAATGVGGATVALPLRTMIGKPPNQSPASARSNSHPPPPNGAAQHDQKAKAPCASSPVPNRPIARTLQLPTTADARNESGSLALLVVIANAPGYIRRSG